MSKQSLGLIIAGILVLLGGALLFANSNKKPSPLLVNLNVSVKQSAAQTIQVKQGQTVKITFNSDINDEAHLHGYDILTELEANKSIKTEFIADLTGKFELEAEKSGQLIAVFQVSAK